MVSFSNGIILKYYKVHEYRSAEMVITTFLRHNTVNVLLSALCLML